MSFDLELFKKLVDVDYQRIHVIDMETFEVVYANKASIDTAVNSDKEYIGDKCYHFFFDKSCQCEKCPLKNDSIESSFIIEKAEEKRTDIVHTEVFDWKGRRFYAEFVEDATEVKNSLEERKNGLELISALSDNYLNIFLVNPDKKTASIIKLDGYVTYGLERDRKQEFDYSTIVSQYIKDRVYSEDVSEMTAVMNLNNVISNLEKSSAFSGKYRVKDKEEIHYYQYKFIKMQRTDMIVAGFSNIDDVVNLEIKHENAMKLKEKEILQSNSDRDRQLEILRLMSKIYYSMHYIDLINNTTIEYTTSEVLKPFVNKTEDASGQLYTAMKHRTSKLYLDRIMEFVNLSTLPERMKGKRTIYMDFVNVDGIWLRASFIAIDTNTKGLVESVIYTTQVVHEEKTKEEDLILKSYTDELTGFYNRHAYERDVKSYKEGSIPNNLFLVNFDVNGLKLINDTKGHSIGDELLLCACECMKKSFGSYGTLYRTGGDEFAALITTNANQMDFLLNDFNGLLAATSTENIDDVSVSVGYISPREFPSSSFDELEEIADKRMYDNKKKHYEAENASTQ